MKRPVTVIAAVLALTACTPPPSSPSEAPDEATTAPVVDDRTIGETAFDHLAEFQRIGEEYGTRAHETEGYDASVEYVISTLEAAGYEAHRDEHTLDVVVDSEVWFEIDGYPITVIPMEGTPSTDGVGATAPLVATDTPTGCSADDYAEAEGSIVVVQRGECSFGTKAVLAGEAGALGLLVYNSDNALFAGELDETDGAAPAVAVAGTHAERLLAAAAEGQEATLQVNVEYEETVVVNVIAEWPGASGPVTMVGAHLDSVEAGPGINDNASGVSLVLALAESLAADGVADGLRLGFWGAEEIGLLGSSAYVDELTDEELDAINAYVNLDMVMSPNGLVGTYGDGDALDVLEAQFGAEEFKRIDLVGYSDHAPFAARDITVAGIFTGAGESLESDEAEQFDGDAGEPRDACYHEACDTLDNVDDPDVHDRLEIIADGTRSALEELLAD